MSATRSRCWFCFHWFSAADLVAYTLVGHEDQPVRCCRNCHARRTAMRQRAV